MKDILEIQKIGNGCNCFLVTKGEDSILIDAGRKGKVNQMIEACKKKQVKMLLLTHGHMDHIEGAGRIAEELQIPIAMHPKDADLIENNLSQRMVGRGLFGKMVAIVSKLGIFLSDTAPFQIDIPILEEEIQVGKLRVRPILLPGHTKGSVGYLIDDQLFVGDALMNMRKPEISLLYEDLDALVASEERIKQLEIATIHFGHGDSIAAAEF